MIHDEIVTYEVARLAKEKGFDVPTRTIKVEKIEGTEKEVWDEEECRYITQWETRSVRIPTQSLLQRWLREEKKYAISVFWDMLSKDYRYEIVKTIGVLEIQAGEKYNYSNPKGFDTYELALEDALKYALENLV
jgi:hypothetical protein